MKNLLIRRGAAVDLFVQGASGRPPSLGRQSFWHSLRVRLPLVFGLLVVVLLATFVWATYREVGDTLVENGVERSRIAAEEIAGTLTRSMQFLVVSQQALIDNPAVHAVLRERDDASRAAVTTLLLPSPTPVSRRIELWDTAGQRVLEIATIAADTLPGIPRFPPDPAPHAAGISVLQPVDSFAYFSITLEVRDSAAADAPLLGFYRRYGRLSASAGSLVTKLLGDDVLLRIGAPGTPVWTDLMLGTPAPPTREENFEPGEYRAPDGQRWTGAMAAIEGTPWMVWVGFPRRVIMAPATTFIGRMAVIAVLLVGLTMVLIALLGFGLTRPLHALTDAAEEIAAGDYGGRVEIRRRDEIGRLSTAFNIMSTRVEDAHDALHDTNQLTNFALAAARIGVWETQLADGHMTCSNSMALVHGLDDGRLPQSRDEFLQLVHEDDRSHMRDLLEGRLHGDAVFDVEYRALWPDASVHWIEGKGRVKLDDARRRSAVLGVSIDVTDRRRLEAQVRQSQKMEAVGQLAGGIAHDFNNLLTAIVGHGELLLGEVPEQGEAREDVAGILNAAESATRLTRQLLTFSRRTVLQPEVLSPNKVIVRTESLLRRLIPAHIDLHTELYPDVPPIRVDPSHLEQVIINLALNARDAMPDGGSLTIATQRVQIDDEASSSGPPSSRLPGEYAMIRVTDTGTGMDADTQARIFEPFFTTKAPGKGTGLGLATVFGIVQQSGGTIDMESQPGAGTTFRVWLPAVNDVPAATAPTPTPRAGAGNETILVVEDDAAVRTMAARMLRVFGYRVETAASGEEALLKLAVDGAQPDLVLTDVMMPGMTGDELFQELAALYPHLRVLFTSGYAADAVGFDPDSAPFIEKPYTADALARKVREALGNAPA